MKKLSIGAYLTALAAILGAVGVVLTIVSSNMSRDNALTNLTTIVAAGVVAVILVCVALYAPTRWGNHNPITAVCVVAAIPLYVYVFGSCISQRIMLIAGLFSYNAGNTLGWSIFYVCVGAAVCLLLGCVLLIAGSFLKSVKDAA